jgi:hypothetical protein
VRNAETERQAQTIAEPSFVAFLPGIGFIPAPLNHRLHFNLRLGPTIRQTKFLETSTYQLKVLGDVLSVFSDLPRKQVKPECLSERAAPKR